MTNGKNKTKVVSVYTNAKDVELTLNGKSLGKQPVSKYDKATFVVEFEAGTLKAVGGGVSDEVVTAGAAAALALVVETKETLDADGADVSLLTAFVNDKDGNVVLGDAPTLKFEVSGACSLLGLGNGDPTDHSVEGTLGTKERRTYGGLARAIIQSTHVAGEITVTVKDTKGALKPATVTLKSVKPVRNQI